MKKRILCTLLSAAMLLTSSPVVFAAETQPVKEQQTKETLPFTIKEANNDIKDESVKGWHVQITDTENAKVVADYPGLVVVRAKKTQYDDNVYLIGKSGIVQTFVVSGTDTDWDENEHIYDDWERTTSYSSVDAIWRLSYKGDRLYYIKKPQTQTPKYDIYNATTGKYFEYDLDEQPEPYRDGEGAVTDVYRFVKDGKVGMLKSDATILYEAEYDDIDRNAFNTDFSDESIRESDDKFFQAMKRDENSDKNLYGIVDSKGLWDGVCKYRSITSNTSGSRICVKNVDEETAVMDINTGELLTGFTGSRIYSLGDGCFLKSNGLGMYDEGKQILMKNGQVIDKNQIYNNDYCNNPNCTVYINVFWDIIENFSEDGCYLVGFDGNGKKHFVKYLDNYLQYNGKRISYDGGMIGTNDNTGFGKDVEPIIMKGGYAVERECADVDPTYNPVMEDHTVKCTLIDANSDPVYELGDNKVVYGLEVRDDLLYLRYGTYGKEDTNVLIYDTISKKIVLNEMNIDSWSIPKDHSSHVVSLQKGNKAALFNTLDRTFSGWDMLGIDLDEESFGSVKESLVGSELVFFIRNKNAFYNASFQKIAQLDLEEDLYYRDSDVSVTKNGNFVFSIGDSVDYGQYQVYDHKGVLLKKYIDGSNYNADTLIRVRTEGTREWGYCDEDGNLQIAEQFNLAGNMHNGIAKVGEWYDDCKIIDQTGKELLSGKYDFEWTYVEAGFAMMKQDGGCYLYDFTGFAEDMAQNPYSLDDLFGKYHHYLRDNQAYKTMHRTLYDAAADVLAARTDNDELFSVIKTLSGDVIVRPTKQILEAITGKRWEEDKLEEEVAIELIRQIDEQDDTLKNVVDNVCGKVKNVSKFYKLVTAAKKPMDTSVQWELAKLEKGDALTTEQAKTIFEQVKGNWSKIDGIFKKVGIATSAVQVGTTICIMANLEMETVNQLLNSAAPDSTAYKGLKKLKGKLQKYWASSEVAIQEFIVDKYFEEIAEALVKKGVTDMAKLFDPLSGIDVGGALTVGKLFYSRISKQIKLADYDELVKIAYSMSLCNSLSVGLNNKYAEIAQNYQKTGKTAGKKLRKEYQFAYEAYEASLLQMANKCSELAEKSGENAAVKYKKKWLDQCISLYSQKMRYDNFIATCRRNMNRTEAANFEYRTDENNHVWIVSLNGKKTKDASRRMTRALSDTQDLLCIPETINGRTVVGIDPQAFRNEDKIHAVFLPDTVTEIGSQAFENCSSLDMVVSGNGLETIGSDAFAGCDSLTGVEVPDSVTEIGDSAFGDNANLTLWCSENGTAWQYAETNGIMAEERIRRAVSVEVAAPADKQQYGSSEKEIDTTGLTLNVTWDDGTSEEVTSGYYAYFKEKTAENAMVAVQYDSAETTYEAGITPEEKDYTVYYKDEAGDDLAEASTVRALFGSSQTLDAPDVSGYTPEKAQMTVTAGDEDSWTFIYKKKNTKKNIEDGRMYVFGDLRYTGNAVIPRVSVEDADGKILKEGVDYEVFLDDNVEIGEAWAGVHGIGDYEGLLSSTFYIVNPGSQDQEPDPSPNPRPGTDSSKSILIGSIKISGISNKIAAGKKIALKANISPANATNKTLVWTSSNPKAATVNANGIVTMKKGSGGKKVTITAKAADGSGKKAVYTITGMKGVVKKVTISGKKTVKAGKSIKLKAKVKATKKANTRLFWKSSNQKFATVKNGKVKAKKNAKGKKVKITAMATDGSGKKKSVTIKIR